jgi:hypothetical protein
LKNPQYGQKTRLAGAVSILGLTQKFVYCIQSLVCVHDTLIETTRRRRWGRNFGRTFAWRNYYLETKKESEKVKLRIRVGLCRVRQSETGEEGFKYGGFKIVKITHG